MRLHGTPKLNSQQPTMLRVQDASHLRKRAEMSGIPVFAWRMAAAQKLSIAESDRTVRRRHD